MKNNYAYPVAKLFFVLFLSLITLNSCKKEFAPIGNNTSINTLTDGQKVHSTEITCWINKTLKSDYQAQIQLSNAQQNVINGQHVVKIPIGKDAALFFTKVDGILRAYAYKWLNQAPGTAAYTGYITAYSFQANKALQTKYKASQIVSQSYLLINIATKTISPVKTSNFIVPANATGGGLTTFSIGDIFGEFWCWLTGGTYITQLMIDNGEAGGANGEVGMPGCDYSGAEYSDPSGDTGGGGGFGFDPSSPGYPGDGSNPGSGDGGNYGGGPSWVDPGAPTGNGCTLGGNCSGDWTLYNLPAIYIPAYNLIRALNISDDNTQEYLINHLQLVDALNSYLAAQGYSQDSNTFALWAVNYLVANPSVTFDVFQNQFWGSSEGTDGAYDSAYWDDPNLSFSQQNLPSWSNFTAAFPLNTDPLYDSPYKMYNSVGGQAGAMYSGPNTNTCALRMSKGLNYSGITIPNIPGKTYKGADNKYYFLSAIEINKWMRKTFGTNDGDPTTPLNTNHYHYTGAQAGPHGVNLPALLNGKKGIYSLVSSDYRWATGHADLLNANGTCGNECHFYDAPILYIDVWVLN